MTALCSCFFSSGWYEYTLFLLACSLDSAMSWAENSVVRLNEFSSRCDLIRSLVFRCVRRWLDCVRFLIS